MKPATHINETCLYSSIAFRLDSKSIDYCTVIACIFSVQWLPESLGSPVCGSVSSSACGFADQKRWSELLSLKREKRIVSQLLVNDVGYPISPASAEMLCWMLCYIPSASLLTCRCYCVDVHLSVWVGVCSYNLVEHNWWRAAEIWSWPSFLAAII